MPRSRLRPGQWIKHGGEASNEEDMVKGLGGSSESQMMQEVRGRQP